VGNALSLVFQLHQKHGLAFEVLHQGIIQTGKSTGQLLLDSKVGQGTCVTLALPDHRTDAVLEEPRADYAGGFQPALLELADGLPFHAFQQVHLDD